MALDVTIQELSDKVLVIRGSHLLNDNGKAFWSKQFEDHGFKVIWCDL